MSLWECPACLGHLSKMSRLLELRKCKKTKRNNDNEGIYYIILYNTRLVLLMSHTLFILFIYFLAVATWCPLVHQNYPCTFTLFVDPTSCIITNKPWSNCVPLPVRRINKQSRV
jgi:hypothetical protein